MRYRVVIQILDPDAIGFVAVVDLSGEAPYIEAVTQDETEALAALAATTLARVEELFRDRA